MGLAHCMKIKFILTLSFILLCACGGRIPNAEIDAFFQAAVLSPTQDSLLIFDLLNHRVRAQIRTGEVPDQLLLGDGGLVFVGHRQEPSVAVFQRMDSGRYLRIGKIGSFGAPGAMAWNPIHRELYIASGNASLLGVYRVQGLQRPLLTQTLRLNSDLGQPRALAVSPDGQSLYIAGQKLQAFQRSDEKLSASSLVDLPERSDIADMVLKDATLFLADRQHDQILVADSQSLELEEPIALTESDEVILPSRLAANHAGSKLYLTAAGASLVQVIDIQNRSLLNTLRLNDSETPSAAPNGIAISADDRRIYVSTQMGRNLVILEGSPELSEPDNIVSHIGTAVHEALLPPLGPIRIF